MLCLAAAGWIPGNARDAVAAKLNTFPLSSNYSLLDHSMCKMPVDRKKLQISSFSAMCEIQLGSMYSITSLTTNLGRSLQTNHRWYPLALAALLPLSIQGGLAAFAISSSYLLPIASPLLKKEYAFHKRCCTIKTPLNSIKQWPGLDMTVTQYQFT